MNHAWLAAMIAGIALWSTGCGGGGSGTQAAGATGATPPVADPPPVSGPGNPPYQNPSSSSQIQGTTDFAQLVRLYSKGQVTNMPWAGYWWPFLSNGTASASSRYENAGGTGGATNWEISNHGPGVPGVQDWWGHCNGWAAAAVLYQEPRSSAGGFSVADQKALLSEVAMEVNADFFGQRAMTNNPSDPAFQDVFPNEFFLLLTNIVGKGLPMVMDRYAGDQVWNQPIAGYVSAPVTPADDLGPDPSAPGVYRVSMATQVWWLRDDVDGSHVTEPFAFADGPSYQSRVYRYEVWLDGPLVFDSAGNLQTSGKVIVTHQGPIVVGGAWTNGDLDLVDSHPDYLWIPHSLQHSSGFSNPYVDATFLERSFAHRH